MIYREFSQEYEDQVVSLWNRTLTFDILTKETFENKALFDDNFDVSLTYLAINE